MASSVAAFDFLGSGASDLFGGAGALQSAGGLKSSAAAYYKAGDLYDQQADVYGEAVDQSKFNAGIAKLGNQITQLQVDREAYKVIGGQRADVAGAGLKSEGSALDILRSSMADVELTKNVLTTQGNLDQGGYKLEQTSYKAMMAAAHAAGVTARGQGDAALAAAKGAKTSAIGSIIKGVIGIGSSLAMFAASDARLKKNITFFDRRDDGIAHYLFQYLNGDDWYYGVMAQEVIMKYPDAVIEAPNGYLMVNYAAIGERCMRVGHA